MPTVSIRPQAAIALLVMSCALALAGCGTPMSGTWTSESGQGSLEFRADGKAYMTSFGGTLACTYVVDGDRILLKGPNGTQVLTRRGNRLEAGLGQSFVQR